MSTTTHTAIATIRAGAFDFLPKPFDVEDVVVAVERAVRDKSLRKEVQRLRGALAEPSPPKGLLLYMSTPGGPVPCRAPQ